MFLGRVVGTVWATKKDHKLEGLKFQIVKKVDQELNLKPDFAIAVDSVGAGAGELVLCAAGSSARMTPITQDKPVDTVIMAIVDQVDFDQP
ncbi:MAG: EutN/CcmL family microcompartment protein [Candidatus Marinimicrobia bacterium]|nr:EutN/CcmL family microcompartment protein [Candidatus Neomarinimicrobiota bacterium]